MQAIGIVGAVAVVAVYWAIWYAAGTSRRKAFVGKDTGLKWLWRFNAGTLLGSGACFIAAGILNRPTGSYAGTLTPIDAIDYGHTGGGVDTAQIIFVLVTVIVLGTMGVIGVKRTAKVKAAEVAAAKIPAGIPSGYTIQTEARPNPANYVPSFAERIGASRAENIIEEIKAGSW